jgi:hypothetical protein
MQRKLSLMTVILMLIGLGILILGFSIGLNHHFETFKEMSGIIQMACFAFFCLVVIAWLAGWGRKST